MQKYEIGLLIIPYTKVNSKLIKVTVLGQNPQNTTKKI